MQVQANFHHPARALLSALCLAAAGAAAASDNASLDVAAGYADQVGVLAVNVTFDRAAPLVERPSWRLGVQYEFGVTVFEGRRSDVGGYKTLAGFSGVPVVRVEWPRSEWPVFVEAGLGAMLLTHTKLQLDHQFSTAFQFLSLGGVGVRFGRDHAYEVGLRLEHMSNADIKGPNNGLTYGVARFAWRF